jgi:hypothetical protein
MQMPIVVGGDEEEGLLEGAGRDGGGLGAEAVCFFLPFRVTVSHPGGGAMIGTALEVGGMGIDRRTGDTLSTTISVPWEEELIRESAGDGGRGVGMGGIGGGGTATAGSGAARGPKCK